MKKALKLHKSIEEQIELLKSRGLIISDDAQASVDSDLSSPSARTFKSTVTAE